MAKKKSSSKKKQRINPIDKRIMERRAKGDKQREGSLARRTRGVHDLQELVDIHRSHEAGQKRIEKLRKAQDKARDRQVKERTSRLKKSSTSKKSSKRKK